MRTRFHPARAIATAMAVGALMAGSMAVTPDVYHDMKGSATTSTVTPAAATADDGGSTSPDVYHDM
jgi:hypothetical protein